MSYLVLECHPGYAIVLDNEGRFLKVANLSYQVGQTVTSVVEANVPEPAGAGRRRSRRPLVRIASMAACLCLLFLGAWQFLRMPYGTVRMQINPDVQMTVNRLDYVIGLEGLNNDGEALVGGYGFRMKKVDQVSDELADRAAEMGYLKEGGAIRLTVESKHGTWKTATEERLLIELEVHTGASVTVVTAPPGASDGQEIVIPIPPAETTPAPPDGGSEPEDDDGPEEAGDADTDDESPDGHEDTGSWEDDGSHSDEEDDGDDAPDALLPDDDDDDLDDGRADHEDGNPDDDSEDDDDQAEDGNDVSEE